VSQYSEQALIERPAIALLESMGWAHLNCLYEVYGSHTPSPDSASLPLPVGEGRGEGADRAAVCLGRETPNDVLLEKRLVRAIRLLNPDLPEAAIRLVLEELTRDRSAMTPVAANRELYTLLKDGVKVQVEGSALTPSPSPTGRGARGEGESDGERVVTVRLIDWEHPKNNDFLLTSQLWITGDLYKRRADLVGFVNGIPLVFIELKASHKRLKDAWDRNLKDYKDTIPHAFLPNAFIILSNGSESRIGTLSSEWDHFAEWKYLTEGEALTPTLSQREREKTTEGEALTSHPSPSGRGEADRLGEGADTARGRISLETMLRGVCDPSRLLDLVENFTLFTEAAGGLVKLVAKNHQYLGVKNAIAALEKLMEANRRGNGISLTPALSQGERGQYRGGLPFSGLLERARELRKKQTPAEEIMWDLLRDRQYLGLKFRRQHQYGNYVIDFYCDEAKLAVELIGSVHQTKPEQKKKDKSRDKYLQSQGLTVIHIPNEVVFEQTEEALARIQSALPSPTGRRTEDEGNTPGSGGRLGVFWHTQGSGKSYSMLFFAQSVLRKMPGDWTFVIVTDRDELDKQIYRTFKRAGAVSEEEVKASSSAHLRSLLGENHRYIFTLIHKFRPPKAAETPSPPAPLPKGEGSLAMAATETPSTPTLLPKGEGSIIPKATETPSSPALLPRGEGCKTPTASETPSPGPDGHPLPLGEGWGEGVMPVLSDRHNIIVITDEAHRSQYDAFALNMRNALPNAAFIGFTGTPLVVGEEKTRQVFGDYVSVYDFRQSVEDGATVPLFYENRIPELQLTNPYLNEEMQALLDAAMLDEAQEGKLERVLAQEYHLITRNDRLEKVAEDIVAHFMGRGHMGKAMVVCIDKATAVRMHHKVKTHWSRYLDGLRTRLKALEGQKEPEESIEELRGRILFMEQTDMAVVVSQSQGEVDEMRKKGLSMEPHRRRMVTEDLDEKFKKPDDPFRIVFVCAMWMTGFDVPCCSTIYLDKPMRNHTLMQTIARANRVFMDKLNGLIVDYVGIFRDLKKALAIYGPGPGLDGDGETPVQPKAELIKALRRALEVTAKYCSGMGVDLEGIRKTEAFHRVKALDDAVELLIVNDDAKRKYLGLANRVDALYKAILPDPLANEFTALCKLIHVLAEKMRSLMPVPDIAAVLAQVGDLLDRSVAPQGYVMPHGSGVPYDLSRIDFDKLKQQFEKGKKRTEAERLRRLMSEQISALVRQNKARINYYEKFQKLIEEYNTGSINVEKFFDELLKLAQALNEEEKRHIGEQLSEEELALFDLLTQPEPKLKKKEELAVKKVARELLETLKKEKLVLDWRKKQQARAAVLLAIEEKLDELPPEPYPKDLYQQKCALAYQHVYDSYYGSGQSIYGQIA